MEYVKVKLLIDFPPLKAGTKQIVTARWAKKAVKNKQAKYLKQAVEAKPKKASSKKPINKK